MSRRFIAGAVCPECQKMDKIVTYKQDGEDVAECISCGYLSHRPKAADMAKNDMQPKADALGVVKIIPK